MAWCITVHRTEPNVYATYNHGPLRAVALGLKNIEFGKNKPLNNLFI